MSPPIFPDLRRLGQGWPVKKSPMQSTMIAPHVSGREVRVTNYAQTLWQFEATFNVLTSNGNYPGAGRDTTQIMMDFFNAARGSFRTFLYTDPGDSRGTGVPLTPIGDGSTTTFAFQRALYDWFEPVGYLSAVYLDGVAQTGDWTLANPTAAVPSPNLTFTGPPGAGVVVTADFNWQFVCRFSDDSLEFQEDMDGLWSLKSVKFQSVRNGGF
jgi:uncharacterized protein (TIGR02217 family)